MRSLACLRAGARSCGPRPRPPQPTMVVEEGAQSPRFSGRVHSESYSQQNLAAAFRQLIGSPASHSASAVQRALCEYASDRELLLDSLARSRLTTLQSFRTAILASLDLPDPSGRIYSKNVRQLREILSFDKWTAALPPLAGTPPGIPDLTVRNEVWSRPTLADRPLIRELIFDFWGLEAYDHLTLLVAYSGHPHLIDELLKLPNVKRVIAIEELPEYCVTYADRWMDEIARGKLCLIKNDGYWWESYSEVEDLGLLDDCPICPFDQRHPSLFFICQLPFSNPNRSIQFVMQILSFLPHRNWCFQYGKLNLAFITSGEIAQRLGRRQSEDLKYSRINATLNALVDLESFFPTSAPSPRSVFASLFPYSIHPSEPHPVPPASSSKPKKTPPSPSATPTATDQKQKRKKVYKSSVDVQSLNPWNSILLKPKIDVGLGGLSVQEFECLCFLQKVMFIHSASSWVDSISHAAAGASVIYDRLKQGGVIIDKEKHVRALSSEEWLAICKEFNRWPFKPKSFENDLELDNGEYHL